ncbi:MAG: SecF protein [Microgenomates group bacterium GW2011_GWA2_46_7]|nr:MAG: SecF protein [Microgenomates group bacterium GW2011_GWC2_46_7]KKU46784.1 MAG: SecF protein [Microgenomates group bacterium GW2011_GWA2_46_7]
MDTKLKILEPMKYWWIYFLLSLCVIIPGSYSLIKYGLKPSIDFTGGTNIVWNVQTDESTLRRLAQESNIALRSISSQNNIWTISTNPLDKDLYQSFKAKVVGAQELSLDTIGPTLGAELIQKTLTAIILAATLILLYVAYRFKNIKFGVSAIIAMLHDSLVLLGTFSLLGHYLGVEVDTLFVTALLTILSFSVHDTIVVYDRIRELKKKHSYLDFADIVNRAILETMGRSINNSMTIIFMLLSMYLLGGDTTAWFIFALLVGTISGTYSSTFTAAPLLIVWDKFTHRQKNHK